MSNFLTLQYGFRQLTVDKNVTTSTRGPTSDSLLRYEENHQQTAKDEYSFVDVQELLDFVTLRWRELWVTTSLSDETVLEILSRRPFFLLISVDAPLCTRWERYRAHCVGKGTTPPSIDQFVICHDEQLYSQTVGIAPLLHRAQLRLLNSSPSLEHLHAALRIIDIPNESRLRPNWDLYFMQLAALAAQRSNCMKRRVGCVLVRERKVVSTGYNGTPRGITNCNEGGCKSARTEAKTPRL